MALKKQTKHHKKPTVSQYRDMMATAGDTILILDLLYDEITEMNTGTDFVLPESVSDCSRWFIKNFDCAEEDTSLNEVFLLKNLRGEWDIKELLLRRYHPAPGGAVWFRCIMQRDLHNPDIIYLMLRDVDTLYWRETEMRRRADVDSLTGILNRGSFEKEVARRLQINPGKHRGFFMLDVDNFKQINDTYGHREGDTVLRNLAFQMEALFPRPHLIGRMGGDEFVVLMEEDASPAELARMGEKLIRHFSANTNNAKWTCSVGVCLLPQDGTTFDEIYQHADLALYHAKKHGKNQYSFYSSALLGEDGRQILMAMRDQKSLPFLQETMRVENDFLVYLLEELYQTEDASTALENMLEYIARYFKMKAAYLFCLQNNCGILRSSWCEEGIKSAFTENEAGEYKTDMGRFPAYLERNGIYYTSKMEELPGKIGGDLVAVKSKHVIAVPFFGKNDIVEFMLLESREDKEFVQKKDLKMLRIAAQVISAHLQYENNLRSLNRRAEDIRTFMDDVKNGIYVVEKETYRLLYRNAEMQRAFGREPIAQRACYQVLQDSATPCENCPLCAIDPKKHKGKSVVYARTLHSYLDMTASEILWDDDIPSYLLTACRRQTDTKGELLQPLPSVQKALKIEDERYKIIVKQTGASVFEWSPEKKYVASGILDAFAVDPERDLMVQFSEPPLLYPDDLENFLNFRKRLRNGKNMAEIICRFLTRSGNYRWYRMAVTMLRDENQQVVRSVGSILDVDEKAKVMEALKYKSEYDTLTGIYNFDKFCQAASDFISHSPNKRFAVVVTNVERFKIVNDRFGMEVGDEALRYIAHILRQMVGGKGIYARMQGDEFCTIVPYLTRQDIIRELRHFSNCMQRFREDCPLLVRYGIYLLEDLGMSVSLMVDRARIAVENVRGDTVQPFIFYEKELRDRLLREQQIRHEAEAALENGEFEVFLQPKYNLPDRYICGAEALVRWRHPTRGLIAPAAFLPLMEQNGMILRLDQYVWEETVKILARWKKEGRKLLPISVNVSRRHTVRSTLTSVLRSLLEKYQVSPQYLHLELTETLLVENQKSLVELMDSLRRAGFIIEMDDFGSGYSSLNILRDVPVDIIKLDKGFLDETLTGPRGQTVIRHVLYMARDLGLSVVAEGVETDEQMRFLRQTNCDMIQGYFIAKPMPVSEFELFAFEDGKTE